MLKAHKGHSVSSGLAWSREVTFPPVRNMKKWESEKERKVEACTGDGLTCHLHSHTDHSVLATCPSISVMGTAGAGEKCSRDPGGLTV